MLGVGVLLIILGVWIRGFGVLVTIGVVRVIIGLIVNVVPLGGRRPRVW